MISPSRIYLKLAHFRVKIAILRGVGGTPKICCFTGILLSMFFRNPCKILLAYDNSFYGLTLPRIVRLYCQKSAVILPEDCSYSIVLSRCDLLFCAVSPKKIKLVRSNWYMSGENKANSAQLRLSLAK